MRKKDYGTGIPEHEMEALVRCLIPEMQKYFESEEGQREFAEWKAEQDKKKSTQTKGNKKKETPPD